MRISEQAFQKRHAVALVLSLAALLGAVLASLPSTEEGKEVLAPSVSYRVCLSSDGTLQLWENADGEAQLLYVKTHVSLREADAALLSQGIEADSREAALMLFEDFAE